MNHFEKMALMGRETSSACWLFNSEYGTEWTCWAEGKANGMKFKIEEPDAATPEEAVDAVFEKWERLVGRVPEFRPALEYAPRRAIHDPRTADDEIPF